MKTKALILTLLVCVLGGMAQANIPNNYAIYTSVSWNEANDPPTIEYSVNVTGTTLPPAPPMGGAVHYAKVYADMNGADGSWQQGPNYCTSCQMNWNSPVWAFDLSTDCGLSLWLAGTCEGGVEDFEVICTVLGTFVNTSGSGKTQHEPAITWVDLSGSAPNYKATHKCSNPPPDMAITGVDSSNPDALSAINGGYCYSYIDGSAKWTCTLKVAYTFDESLPFTVQCTNYDNGQKGLSVWPFTILTNLGWDIPYPF